MQDEVRKSRVSCRDGDLEADSEAEEDFEIRPEDLNAFVTYSDVY